MITSLRRSPPHKESTKLLKLEEVTACGYRSRQRGYVKLRFERDRFAYIHMATEHDYNEWVGRIGSYSWVSCKWQVSHEDPAVKFPVYKVEK